MKLITWNVRGMNKVHRQKEVRLFIRQNNVSILALIEHKIKQQADKVLKSNCSRVDEARQLCL